MVRIVVLFSFILLLSYSVHESETAYTVGMTLMVDRHPGPDDFNQQYEQFHTHDMDHIPGSNTKTVFPADLVLTGIVAVIPSVFYFQHWEPPDKH